MTTVLVVLLIWVGITIPIALIIGRILSINPRDDD
jgi:hypothetical protein